MFKRHSRNKHYWFTIQSPNGQTLATSETYTTAAMRDKGIEAVKKVVVDVTTVKQAIKYEGKRRPSDKDVITGRVRYEPSDTFHLENAKGKIVKR